MAKNSILSKNNKEDWMEEYEGQLAIDVFETDNALILTAPIAGVSPENLDVQISDEFVTIKGEREDIRQAEATGYHVQECYWGAFSRNFEVPVQIDSENSEAVMKNGILTIIMPKFTKSRAKSLKIKTE